MATPMAAAICTCLLVIFLGGGVLSETEIHPQIVDSMRVQIVSKQDDDGKWVNEVKLEHGSEQAPWKVEVEQKTIDRGGRQSVELAATLTGPKPPPQPALSSRMLAGSTVLPTLGSQPVAAGSQTESPAVSDQSSLHGKTRDKEVQEVHSSWMDSYYILHTNQMDWVTANKTCADAGAHLAIINSDEEASFFTKLLNRFPGANRGAFVGITDDGHEGEWVTIDGVSIASAGFARWFRDDQPDNANGNENCGAYFHSYGGLNDIPCTGYLMFSICEKGDVTTRVNASLDNIDLPDYLDLKDYMLPPEEYEMLLTDLVHQPLELGSDYMKFPGLSSFYKIHSKQMDWEEANATCVEAGAHLAIINSEEEAKMLAMILNEFYVDSYRGAFVGITDEAEEGIWLTIFGETLAQAGYDRWFREDQPDNANGNENCGAIYPRSVGFNDVPCTKYLMHSICEKDAVPESTALRSLESDSLLVATTSGPEDREPTTEQPAIDESEYIVESNEMTTAHNDVVTKKDLIALGYKKYIDRYFKLHVDVSKNWEQAQKTCRMEGGALAHVASMKEFSFFRQLVRGELDEFDFVFAEFGSKFSLDSYQDDFEYPDSSSGREKCSAMNPIEGAMEIVPCHMLLPFICEIQVRDEPFEENADDADQSEEFDNTVDQLLSIDNTVDQLWSIDDTSRGLMAMLQYISLNRDIEMTTSPPREQSDHGLDEEDILWSEAESGSDKFEYIDEGEWF